ncbi:hypothetical protein KAFR_0G02570 [Kazachstania africana CBS 2517]|uniref:GB1/RHD3-type G domain-containing protein n=1 Tax=Kazachstania africana (strain ATCC 22294 / BCRC 22015 / CBS 2517 / CECT 1963 / NBRC 1671 / NRRL Y-8276) TaxID=1071382 RepID=H2AY39_KAZAF|nr:hypothetical protein KAFR_0G02570 [Kazachstania africana CBS 2517]CCF59289.1 hypothetical protein KAFR_0G02570 [Kazachstania africana CBS 2517]
MAPDNHDHTLGHESIQLVNESKEFSTELLPYLQKIASSNVDNLVQPHESYHVISVFGSQSSGKSTLLNILFNTTFDTMDAKVKRQQTTKGIWLSHTKQVNTTKSANTPLASDMFILDVEGSDGAERGEDQDFERKAALFAISVSEVLIVNLWEQQIGLYQGNNMGLLKTVFEVNLSLFGKRHEHKILLLFVIRDHVGVTPLSSLSDSLISSLENMWKELNKPQGCEDLALYDLFDLKFVGLSHKLLQEEKFVNDVKALGTCFSFPEKEEYYFKKEYHHLLPLDGWSMYAENCWEQIEHNKDLDLPTQQILVARFKTNEILNESFDASFINDDTFNSELKILIDDIDLKDSLFELLKVAKNKCIEQYDILASRYNKMVYMENRAELLKKISSFLYDNAVVELSENFINKLFTDMEDKMKVRAQGLSFSEQLDDCVDSINADYDLLLDNFMDSELIVIDLKESLKARLDDLLLGKVNELRTKETDLILSRIRKNLKFSIKEQILPLLANPTLQIWDDVMSAFYDLIDEALVPFKSQDSDDLDFGIGLSDNEDKNIADRIKLSGWLTLTVMIHDYLTEDTIVGLLRDRFENKFRFADDDTPILWKNEQQIDTSFRLAKEHAMEILSVLSIVKTSDNVEVVPEIPNYLLENEYTDELGIYHIDRFAHILNELQKEKISKQFRRQINLTVLDAKRSIITSTNHIPMWIYAIIVVLGWNEFMLVIRNPVFVTLLLIGSVAFYFIHKFDLWGPVLSVVNTAIGETKETLKDKLRTFVLEEDYATAKNRDMKDTQSFETEIVNEKIDKLDD